MRNSCLAELGHNEAEGCDAICCGGEPGDSSGPECRCPWGQVRSDVGSKHMFTYPAATTGVVSWMSIFASTDSTLDVYP